MTEPREPTAEMESLLAAAADERLTESDCTRLRQLLEASDDARQSYVEHVILHAMLRWVHASPLGAEIANPDKSSAEGETAADDSAPDQTPLIAQTSPAFPTLLATLPSSYSGFSSPLGSLLFSYLLAGVIVGVGILIGWVCQVSGPQETPVVQYGPRPSSAVSPVEREQVFVGQINAIIDCKWADPRNAPIGFDRIVLGRRYDLVSGLMEIAYDTGARVILQGPCTYRVDSTSGGYLAVGMLTARVEERGERIPANQRATIGSHSFPSPLSIRTPTATVADLGTEFGVEVDKSGASTARVYRGKVEMRVIGDGATNDKVVALEANESARVEIGKDQVARVVRESGRSDTFVRQMPKRVPIKLFNTGVNSQPGEADRHWQLAARSDEPSLKPQPALVTHLEDSRWIPNQSDRCQWISAAGGASIMPELVTYTFRTEFDLTGMRASTAILRGRFAVDNHVRSIRLNSRKIPVPEHGKRSCSFLHTFSCDRGFVEGVNVLEIEVENGEPQSGPSSGTLGLFVELEGSVLTAWPEPSASAAEAK